MGSKQTKAHNKAWRERQQKRKRRSAGQSPAEGGPITRHGQRAIPVPEINTSVPIYGCDTRDTDHSSDHSKELILAVQAAGGHWALQSNLPPNDVFLTNVPLPQLAPLEEAATNGRKILGLICTFHSIDRDEGRFGLVCSPGWPDWCAANRIPFPRPRMAVTIGPSAS